MLDDTFVLRYPAPYYARPLASIIPGRTRRDTGHKAPYALYHGAEQTIHHHHAVNDKAQRLLLAMSMVPLECQ